MFNLLCMDLRRLFKSRSFYIILCVTAALLALLVFTVSAVADPGRLEALEGSGVVVTGGSSEELQQQLDGMTQLDFVHECLGSGFLLVLAGIGVTLFIQSDFSSGYIKNICCARPRRVEYVLAKFLTAGAYSGLVTLLGVLLPLLCALLFGVRLAASPVLAVGQYAFWLWLPCWAFSLMGLVLVALTRSAVLGIVLSVVAGSGLIAALLGALCQRLGLPDLSRFLLSMVVSGQCIPAPGMDQINRIVACSIDWAVLYAIGSLIAMENRDI